MQVHVMQVLPLWSARLGWSLSPLCNMFMSMQYDAMLYTFYMPAGILSLLWYHLIVTPHPECHTRDTRAGMLRYWTFDATDTSHYLWRV